MQVELYIDGQFGQIECPINFPDTYTEEEWYKFVAKAGFRIAHVLGYSYPSNIEVYCLDNVQADCEYPYFVMFDICGQGRIIFMEKWHDLTDFITRHATIFLLQDMTVLIDKVIRIEGSADEQDS